MRRILSLVAILLLVAAGAAEARVVQASPADTAERGGQALPRGTKDPGCAMAAAMLCAAFLPFRPFGWFGPQDADMVSRLNAATRIGIAGERAAWRRPRIIGRARLDSRPLAFQRRPPPKLR